MKLFRFDRAKALWVGIERECFLSRNGSIAPIAAEVLDELPQDGGFGYELSACQLEERVGPCEIGEIHEKLVENAAILEMAERRLGFSRLHTEVGPEDMPLDVYPDPSGRYAEITKNMPRHILLAACRVTGTHIHVGMPDHDTALRVYNQVIGFLPGLCQRGNGSFGERLAIYRVMAPDCKPPLYESWENFYRRAVEKGFDEDPRRCWTLIRISIHGTIEFRMFGTTSSLERIVGWAKLCHQLCAEAMP